MTKPSNQQRVNAEAKDKGARIERPSQGTHLVHTSDGSVIICKSFHEVESAVKQL